MKKRLPSSLMALIMLLTVGIHYTHAQTTEKNAICPQQFNDYFAEAYSQHPDIPHGVLEAVAYTNTRLRHLFPDQMAPSCIGLPGYHGLMGLVEDGKGYFRNNLLTIAQLSGYTPAQMKANARDNILAYAAAYDILQKQCEINSPNAGEHLPILRHLSELPHDAAKSDDFAMLSHLYSVLHFINDYDFRAAYDLTAPLVDIKAVFGKHNYRLLTTTHLDLSHEYETKPTPSGGGTSKTVGTTPTKANCSMPNGPAEYPGAYTWDPNDPSNYSTYTISPYTVAIHTIQGSYSGAISWFKNPSSNVSIHYCVRAFDGQVTQMACHTTRCWHVSSENSYAVGIEHEGYIADGEVWYTKEAYESSADLTKFIAADRGIDLLETYDGPGIDGLQTLSHTCYKIKGHQSFTGNTHVDPGPEWDWYRYYRLLNDLPTPTSHTTASGTVYDTGGAGANYPDEERSTWLIQPAGAASISLTFTAWDVENDYDFLWIYDGTDDTGNLIGKYSGTSPGTVTAWSGSLFLEFRSDCATNGAGWVANYTSSTSPPGCPPPDGLSEAGIYGLGATLNWNVISGAQGYELRLKRDTDTAWEVYTTTDNSLELTGLQDNKVYEWKVRSDCGSGTYSGYAGSSFLTPSVGLTLMVPEAYTTTLCEGNFYDSGGNDGNYANHEEWTYTIAPVGATSITVNFGGFNLENNYDYLYIYDGANTSAPPIGPSGGYTGSNSPGTFTSTGGTVTFKFDSDTWTLSTGWAATWTCSASGCAPSASIADPPDWASDDFTATFNDDPCSSSIDHAFYLASDYDGSEWRANDNIGFFNDEFDGAAIHPDWAMPTGTWSLNDNAIYQSNESLSNTNAHAALTQAASEVYLYEWDMKIDGSGSNRRAGFHFFCSDATLTNRGESYFVWLRADDNKLEFYKVTNNVFSLEKSSSLTVNAGIMENYKTIYDPSTGKISVYRNNALLDSWTDASPITSGNAISLRTGNCETWYDNVRVYKARSGTETVTVGNAATDAIGQQSASSAVAGRLASAFVTTGNVWKEAADKTFKVDWTAPAIVSTNDGSGVDIDATASNTFLSANWTAASDAHSGIIAYSYAIGTTPGGNDVVDWTDNGNETAVMHTGLSLTSGQTYYVSVKAENGAALQSLAGASDGITIENGVSLQAWALLEGAFTSAVMRTDLRDNDMLPLSGAFDIAPWSHNEGEGVARSGDFPANAVDWVLVELRDAANITTVLAAKAGLLLSNGSLADLDGTPGLRFGVPTGNYYVVLRHRNHLDVLSVNALALPNAVPLDFRDASQVAGGASQLADLTGMGSIYGLSAGDFDGNGVFTVADYNLYKSQMSLLNGYYESDCSLDGNATTDDYNLYLLHVGGIGVAPVRY